MGLDMVPIGKPLPGFEVRFNHLFSLIQGKKKQIVGFIDKLKGKKVLAKEEMLEEWFAIQISPCETIRAPRVGRDKEADEWLKVKYQSSDKTITEVDFIRQHQGYYVIELAKETEGLAVYVSPVHDQNVFRGQFITDCVKLIGKDLVEEAWETKLARETLSYGHKLMAVADKIAKQHNLEYLKAIYMPPEYDEDSIESQLHIVYSMAKWLIFYGENGHGYEADF